MPATGWLSRIRSIGRGSALEADRPPEPVIRAAPGLAALFASLEEDRSHAVLDLGAASEASFSIYSRHSRQVRFADLSATSASLEWASALDEAGRTAVEPYDVLLLWDTLFRVPAEERPFMVARLAELAAPVARLHMVLEAPERTGPRPIRFSVADSGHMRHELSWDETAAPQRLLPSDVERMLGPFQVVHGFTLKDGLREYLAVRRTRAKSVPEGTPTVRAVAGREQRPAAPVRSGNSSRLDAITEHVVSRERVERALRNGTANTSSPPETN